MTRAEKAQVIMEEINESYTIPTYIERAGEVTGTRTITGELHQGRERMGTVSGVP